MVKTSTPKKINFGCEDCAYESELWECVDCIVKLVRDGYGGMNTATYRPASCSVDMGEIKEIEGSRCCTQFSKIGHICHVCGQNIINNQSF